MTRKDNILQYFIHGYMFCTIVGMTLLYSAYEIAICLLGIGATSVYISLGVFLSAEVNQFGGICALLWSIMFPIVLIVSYLRAVKKNYRMFILASVLDCLVSILFAVHTVYDANWFGFQQVIVDIVVSFVFLFAFLRVLRLPDA